MIDRIVDILISVPCVLIALTFHEFAHALAAYKLGDPTAKYFGRLTLNPLKHIDIFGAICMLLFRFGWAKSVPIDVRFFKKPRRDMALTALAGPLTNMLLAFVGSFIFCFFQAVIVVPDSFLEQSSFLYYSLYAFYSIQLTFIWLNIALAIFNLIPLPPLDGSRIFLVWLPDRTYFRIMRHERQIAMIFMAILILDSYILDGILTSGLSFTVELIFNGMLSLFSLIF